MARPLQHFLKALHGPERGRAWIGKLVVGRRAILLAPFFVAAVLSAVRDPERAPVEAAIVGTSAVALAYLVRIWCTGYRTWVKKSGETRYLMSAGPYARVRHPLYLANGIAGAGALAALGRWWFLAAYVPLYVVLIAFVIVREEEVLAGRFGEQHARYRAQVPALVPWFGRARPLAEREGTFHWKPVRDQLEPWKLVGVVLASAVVVGWAKRLGPAIVSD